MSTVREESKIRSVQLTRSSRSAHYSLIYLSLLILLLAEPTAQAGTFTDGDVSVYVTGSVFAKGVWQQGAAGGVSLNFNVESLPLGEFYAKRGFKESTRTTQVSDSIYTLQNGALVTISGEVIVGNGRAVLDLFADTITSASLSSEDHGGVPVNNNTSGSTQVYGHMTVVFPASTPYSVLKLTSDTLPDERYAESEGSSVTISDIDTGDASSLTQAPAGVPGKFSVEKSATHTAGVDITVLYGLGATQENAILPSSPPTNTVNAQFVINSAVGHDGPGVTYKPGSTETFTAVVGGRWYDPALSYGFVYEALDETLFTEIINLPNGFSGAFSIWAEGQLLGHYRAGDFLRFEDVLGHGVSSFSVLGITPENEGEVVDAFPIQLDFNSETASFRQHALEPIVQPSLAMSVLPNGWIELLWAAERPSILEQSMTLKMDSWSTALDQGEPAGNDQRRVTFKPIDGRRFFRLRLEITVP